MSPSSNTSRRTIQTVFLDRDGVLNKKMPEGCYVTHWNEFEPLPAVPEAIAALNRAGLRVIVVSNQRGVSQGLYSEYDVTDIHSQFQDLLHDNNAHIDAFYFCPHAKNECTCRKPLPGLYEQAVAQFPEISADSSVMIGDSLSDMEFGHRLGLFTIFIDGNPENRKPGAESARQMANQCFPSLPEAVDFLLRTFEIHALQS